MSNNDVNRASPPRQEGSLLDEGASGGVAACVTANAERLFNLSELLPPALQKGSQSVLKSLNSQVELVERRHGDQDTNNASWIRFSSWLKAALILDIFDRLERNADAVLESSVNQLLRSAETKLEQRPSSKDDRAICIGGHRDTATATTHTVVANKYLQQRFVSPAQFRSSAIPAPFAKQMSCADARDSFLTAEEVQEVDLLVRSQEQLKLFCSVEQHLRDYLEALRVERNKMARQKRGETCVVALPPQESSGI